MRYKLNIAYNGSNYVGFQRQINGLSIQEVIEERLKIIFSQDITIVMASRTDSGVHAYDQVCHFDSDKEIVPYKVKGSLNGLLPNDIHVMKVEIVDEDFHARFSVKRKTYEYKVKIKEYDVFLNGLAYYCPFELDLESIKKALPLFCGKHDFGSFNTASYELYPNQVREIFYFEMNIENDLITFRICGDGFLRHMVRIIIGTMIDLGRGKKTLEDIKEMIDHPNKSNRRFNIDACGLYLKSIEY